MLCCVVLCCVVLCCVVLCCVVLCCVVLCCVVLCKKGKLMTCIKCERFLEYFKQKFLLGVGRVM